MKTILLYCFLATAVAGAAQDTVALHSIFDPAGDSVLHLTIHTDWKNLLAEKKEGAYQTAELSVPEWAFAGAVKIKARGNMRRNICDFPPLKIKFRKADLHAAGLLPFNECKLVVQCGNNDNSKSYINREYLAYQLFHQYSPYSFRVQRVQLSVHFARRKQLDSLQLQGFLIESEEELGARFLGKSMDYEVCSPSHINQQLLQEMAAFQFLIGNTDWYCWNLHNLKVFRMEGYDKLVPVPYDFDYAGIVDAHYATPHASLPIKDVKQRCFMGEACTPEEAAVLGQHLMDFQPNLIELVKKADYIGETEKNMMLRYLESGYRQLAEPGAAAALFKKRSPR